MEEIRTDADINDTVGELLNIVTGNFKSNLCDAGLDCKLAPPKVSRSNNFFVDTVDGGGLERMAFKAGDLVLFVDITVNPWNEQPNHAAHSSPLDEGLVTNPCGNGPAPPVPPPVAPVS